MPLSKELLAEIQAGYTNQKLRMISAHLYGMRDIFLEYFDLPSSITTSFHLDHGVPLMDADKIPEEYAYKNNSLVLLTNESQFPIYKKYTDKPLHLVGALFPKYRAMRGIELAEHRRGTIAFPTHSIFGVDFETGWQQYGEKLLSLPAEFQPITICLYWLDIAKGRHRIFEEMGFDVVSCGYFMNNNFAQRFYDITREFKYATSNEYGSYLPYCVEMGLPFFMYGNRMKATNQDGHVYYPEGNFELTKEYGFELHDYVHHLFQYKENVLPGITSQQRRFTEEVLGLRFPEDKEVIRQAVFKSQLSNFPKFAKDTVHKAIWDMLDILPISVGTSAAKLVKPYYKR